MPRRVRWTGTEPARRPALERVGDFREVNLGYTAEEAIVEAQRCLQCAAPSCEEGCPNNNPIRDFIALIAEGEFEQAAELNWTKNALPSCTGRVCAWEDQCEGFCVMGLRGDPINIGALERFMTDYTLSVRAADRQTSPDPLTPDQGGDESAQPTGAAAGRVRAGTRSNDVGAGRTRPGPWLSHPKVAVIGAGPAGLTVAHFLGSKGYEVTIFESYPFAGGVMSYGIPEFVLPQEVIDREVQRIKALGVTIVHGVTVGRDVTIDELFEQGYAAVFLGIGANAPATLGIPGEDLQGVWTAKDFLMDASFRTMSPGSAAIAGRSAARVSTPALARNGRSSNGLTNGRPIHLGKRVAVVGAGNTAMDAARTALRLGAEEVTVLYRRSEAESPSRPIEVKLAKDEGVQFRYLVNPTRFLGDEDGLLTAVELVKMRLDATDDSGRPRPVPVPGSEWVLPIDTCIVAIGYQPERAIARQSGLTVNRWGGLIVDEETGATNREGVFAGGDCVTGSKTVVHAIAAGRRAAAAIERYLEEREARERATWQQEMAVS